MSDKDNQHLIEGVEFTATELITMLELLILKCQNIRREVYYHEYEPIINKIESALMEHQLNLFCPPYDDRRPPTLPVDK